MTTATIEQRVTEAIERVEQLDRESERARLAGEVATACELERRREALLADTRRMRRFYC